MTHKQILKQAIEKAQVNGYRLPFYREGHEYFVSFCIEESLDIAIRTTKSIKADSYCYEKVIFSYDFAKSFWGDKVITPLSITFKDNEIRDKESVLIAGVIFQYHLQQLAIAEDRLRYIAKFI